MVSNVIMLGVVLLSRLVLLVAGLGTGSVLWWASWVVAPGLQLAILVTLSLGSSNVGLVLVTWLWAIFSEWCEKGALYVLLWKRRAGESLEPRW